MAWRHLRDRRDLLALAVPARERDRQRRGAGGPHGGPRRGDPRHPPPRRIRRRRGGSRPLRHAVLDVLITVLYGIAVVAPAVLLVDRLTPARDRPPHGASWRSRCFPCAGGCSGGSTASSSAIATASSRCSASSAPSSSARASRATSWPTWRPRWPTDSARRGCASAWRGRTASSPPRRRESPATPSVSATEAVDLVHADEVLGRIEVGPRHRGEYSDDERSLLRTVAGQAAASVANVRLTARLAEQLAELTASRERLVAAQDDERRRLERDLHDGIQQDIVAQIAGLRLARNRLDRGQLASAELAELQEQARQTLTDLRELAHGIHPPVLSDNGLVAAIESGCGAVPDPAHGERGRAGPGRAVSRRGRDDRLLRRAGGAREHGEARAGEPGDGRAGPDRTADCTCRSAMTDAASGRSPRHRRTAAGSRTSATASPRSAARCASRRSSRRAPGRRWTSTCLRSARPTGAWPSDPDMEASPHGRTRMALSRSAPGRRTIRPWTAGGCASRRSARSGSPHWSTSSSCAASSTPTSTRTTASPGRCSVRCRCSCSACGCSRCRRRASPCSSRSRSTAMLVGSAYETFVHRNLEILGEPWFPLVNVLGLTADAVATSTLLVVFATFPDGVPERRWQRIAVVFLWTPGARRSAHPAHDAARRDVAVHRHQRRVDPQPVRRAVARVGGARGALPRRPVVGGGRARARRARLPRALRRRPRCGPAPASWRLAVGSAMVAFVLWTFVPGHLGHRVPGLRVDDRHPGRRRSTASSGTARSTSGRATAARASSARRTCSSRSSTRPASRRPRLLLDAPLRTVPAILLTTLLAVVPAAGAQLDAAAASTAPCSATATASSRCSASSARASSRPVDPRELLTRLAEAVRDGLDASWVRIRLVATGRRARRGAHRRRRRCRRRAAVESCDLVRGDETPRPHRARAAAPRRVRRRRAHAAAHGRRPGRGIRRQRAPDRAARRAARRADAPRASGSSPRRTTSAGASSATCTTASSRTSWRRSPGSASPATGCSAASSRPPSSSSCRTRRARRSPTCASSPAASTRRC